MFGRHAELEHLGECSGEAKERASAVCDTGQIDNILLEPELFIVSVRLAPLFEALVLGENIVRSEDNVLVSPRGFDRHIRQHHESAGLLVLELLGTIPFLPDPSTNLYQRPVTERR